MRRPAKVSVKITILIVKIHQECGDPKFIML